MVRKGRYKRWGAKGEATPQQNQKKLITALCSVRYWIIKIRERMLWLHNPIILLCRILGVNRSGYYKWQKRKDKPNRYEQDRVLLTSLLEQEHQKNKFWGYHRLSKQIQKACGWIFSDNLAHKCCKATEIKSKAKKYRYRRPDAESAFIPIS